jgi:hypothetical protein
MIRFRGNGKEVDLTLKNPDGSVIPNELQFVSAFIGYGWWDQFAYTAMVKSPRLVLKGVTVTKGMWEKITDAMQEVGMIVKRKGKPAQVNFLPEKRYECIEAANDGEAKRTNCGMVAAWLTSEGTWKSDSTVSA